MPISPEDRKIESFVAVNVIFRSSDSLMSSGTETTFPFVLRIIIYMRSNPIHEI